MAFVLFTNCTTEANTATGGPLIGLQPIDRLDPMAIQ
jgi:hypothetical protein